MATITQETLQERDPRIASCLPAVLHDVGDYPCHATDVSRTGVRLFGDLPVPSATSVRITLGADSETPLLKTTAKVVRVVGGEVPGEVVVALEFAALDERRTGILDALLGSLQERTGKAAGSSAAAAVAGGGEESSPEARDPGDEGLPAEPPAAVEAAPEPEPEPVHDEETLRQIEQARQAKPQERAQMFRENNRYVLEGLALNPRLSKREIIKLVDNPELLSTSIPILIAHPRARDDEKLQMKLAAHAATPIELALKIARGLSSDGVRQLIELDALNSDLRAHLRLEHPDVCQ